MSLDNRLLANPALTLRALDKLDAEARLRDYIPVVWDILEPGRQFVSGWAVEAICEHLEAVTAGQIRRLVINVPPGCMKSLTANVLWPSWEWGPRNLPHMRYVTASYSQDLTIRDNRRMRNIIVSQTYQELWGDRFQLSADQAAKVRFDTDATGFKIATSVAGLGTGERGDRFIIDDPHNVREAESDAKREAALQWFTEVVPTRINDAERSAIVVIMQRVHDRDTSGLILREELGYEHLCLPMEYESRNRCFTSVPREGAPVEKVTLVQREQDSLPRWLTEPEYNWYRDNPNAEDEFGERYELPAGYVPDWKDLTPQDRRTEDGALLWPERFSPRYLEEDLKPSLQAWGGSFAVAGQLQQRPVPREGGHFKREYFHIVDVLPKGRITRTARAWDLAGSRKKKSAYTVGIKGQLIDGALYITDVRRGKWTPGQVEQQLRLAAEQDGYRVEISIPQDPGQAGLAQKAHLAKKLAGYTVSFTPETGDKEDRARPVISQGEAGNLYLLRASWNDILIGEACLFPGGTFKDQVDALSRLYQHLIRRRKRRLGGAPILIGATPNG